MEKDDFSAFDAAVNEFEAFDKAIAEAEASQPGSLEGQPAQLPPEGGMLETLGDTLQAGARGATFGLYDKALAALGTGADEVAQLAGIIPDTPVDETLKQNLELYQSLKKRQEERSPVATTVGELAGAFVSPLPGSAAIKGLTGAAKVGANVGRSALAGALMGAGEADLVSPEGEFQSPLAEMGSAAGMGAGIDLGLQSLGAVGKGVKTLAKGATDDYLKLFSNAKELTEKGEKFATKAERVLSREADQKKLTEYVKTYADDIKALVEKRSNIIKDLQEKGVTVDLAKERDELTNKILGTDSTLLDQKTKDSLLKSIGQKFGDTQLPDSGVMPRTKVNVKEAEAIRDLIARVSGSRKEALADISGDLKGQSKQFNEAFKNIVDPTTGQAPLKEITEKLKVGKDLEELIKVDDVLSGAPVDQQKLRDASKKLYTEATAIGSLDKGGPMAKESLEAKLAEFRKINPKLADDIKKQTELVSKKERIFDVYGQESSLPGKGVSPFNIGEKGAITAGRLIGNVTGSKPASLIKQLPTKSMDLQRLADKIPDDGGVNSQFKRVVQNALEKDTSGRNAIMFQLQQYPEFRQLLMDTDEDGNE